jgi:hypothetical protein
MSVFTDPEVIQLALDVDERARLTELALGRLLAKLEELRVFTRQDSEDVVGFKFPDDEPTDRVRGATPGPAAG